MNPVNYNYMKILDELWLDDIKHPGFRALTRTKGIVLVDKSWQEVLL
jgi:hypothetical protein